MSDKVTPLERAVEAAAQQMFDALETEFCDHAGRDVVGEPITWAKTDEEIREDTRKRIRIALRAAVPLLMEPLLEARMALLDEFGGRLTSIDHATCNLLNAQRDALLKEAP